MIKNAVLIFIEQYIGVGKTKKQPQKKKTSCCCVPALFVVKWFGKSVFVVVLQTYMLNTTSVAKTILIMSSFFSCLFLYCGLSNNVLQLRQAQNTNSVSSLISVLVQNSNQNVTTCFERNILMRGIILPGMITVSKCYDSENWFWWKTLMFNWLVKITPPPQF